MSQTYRVAFVSVEESTSTEQAVKRLMAKLNITAQKADAFLAGKPLFAPADKTKCMKQAKLLASLGIKSKLIATESNNASSAQSQRDERIFEALDYITSSLIRIEEHLEDLEQRLPEIEQIQVNDDPEQSWQEDEFLEDYDLDIEPNKQPPTRKLLYILASVLVVLLVVLAVAIMYPQWFNM